MLQDLNNAVLQTLQKNGMKSVTWNFLRKLRKIQIYQQTQGLNLANGSALFVKSSCKI